jgi:hypothetical protein
MQPWHYSTLLDLIDHWQPLLAGLLASAAAILVVWFTLKSEHRKADRDLAALRRSLGVEVRQCVTRALGAHRSMRRLAQTQNTPITSRMIENSMFFPQSVIYAASADKIGLLDSHAMGIVAFYGLLEVLNDAIERLLRHRTPDDISPAVVAQTAQLLLVICKQGITLFPVLTTLDAHTNQRDAQLIESIGNEAVIWETARTQWPNIT